ncbi:MAG: group II truncated hemoglobin [Candidatus Thiodiazotropha sp. LLP2]
MQSLPTPYEKIGGEKSVRELVDRFYDIMDEQEDLTTLRQLHAKMLKMSREKLFLFLSGWLGGPSLYVQKYGHPRLRARHLPFSIGIEERDQWLACMKSAMEQMGLSEDFQKELYQAFSNTADFMRNRSE